MKTIISFATTVLASTVLAVGPKDGPARPGPARMPHMGMGEGTSDPIVRMVSNPKMAEQIGLDEAQRNQIKEIEKTNREATAALRKQLRASAEKQHELLKAEKIDEAAVMAEIDNLFDARKQMAKLQMKRVIAVKALLTPEQIAKAREQFANRPKRGMHRPEPPKPRTDEKPSDGEPAEAPKPPEAQP